MGLVPSLLFDLRPIYDNCDLLQRSYAGTAALSAANPATGHCQPTLLADTPGHSQGSLGQSLWSHYSFILGPGAYKAFFVPSKILSPVLCKFWWLYSVVNGDFFQEGLCHTLVYCTQSPCPCSSPLVTVPPQETPKNSSVSVSVGSLGPGAHKVYLTPPNVTGGYGV